MKKLNRYLMIISMFSLILTSSAWANDVSNQNINVKMTPKGFVYQKTFSKESSGYLDSTESQDDLRKNILKKCRKIRKKILDGTRYYKRNIEKNCKPDLSSGEENFSFGRGGAGTPPYFSAWAKTTLKIIFR